jgi:hypothetical protein
MLIQAHEKSFRDGTVRKQFSIFRMKDLPSPGAARPPRAPDWAER